MSTRKNGRASSASSKGSARSSRTRAGTASESSRSPGAQEAGRPPRSREAPQGARVQPQELLVERLCNTGEGIAQTEDGAVFVAGAFPGERVLAEVDEAGGRRRGALVEVSSPSPERRSSRCAISSSCGGCAWIELNEGAQRAAKLEVALSTLEHLGGISRDALEVLSTLSSPRALGYRRRATLHFSQQQLVFFERATHRPVPIDHCPVLVPELSSLPGKLSSALGPMARELDEVALLGEGGQVSLALRWKGKLRDDRAAAVERALRPLSIRGVVMIPKEGSPRVVGRPVLQEALHRDGAPRYLRPELFAQANGEANRLLVETAVDLLAPGADERVLELHAGNGNFTLALAARAKSVLGVELSGGALELARRSATEAGRGNLQLRQGADLEVCRSLVSEGAQFELLFVDPPRSGAPGLGKIAQSLGVRRAVYVACDPASLARDAREWVSHGYRPRAVRVVDLFPQSHHFETVMSFERVSGAPGAFPGGSTGKGA